MYLAGEEKDRSPRQPLGASRSFPPRAESPARSRGDARGCPEEGPRERCPPPCPVNPCPDGHRDLSLLSRLPSEPQLGAEGLTAGVGSISITAKEHAQRSQACSFRGEGVEAGPGRGGGDPRSGTVLTQSFITPAAPEPGVDPAPPAPHPSAPSWARGGDRGAVLGAGGAGGFPSLPAEEEEEEMPRRGRLRRQLLRGIPQVLHRLHPGRSFLLRLALMQRREHPGCTTTTTIIITTITTISSINTITTMQTAAERGAPCRAPAAALRRFSPPPFPGSAPPARGCGSSAHRQQKRRAGSNPNPPGRSPTLSSSASRFADLSIERN